MLLYLVRHGEATKEVDDAARGLTERGMREILAIATYARNRRMMVHAIYHSGKKRALQTAQIFAERLEPPKGALESDGLAPLDEPEIWVKRIAWLGDDIMLIGHLPYLSRLAGFLLCGDKENTHLDFNAGGMACLQRFDDGRWALKWLITPDLVS